MSSILRPAARCSGLFLGALALLLAPDCADRAPSAATSSAGGGGSGGAGGGSAFEGVLLWGSVWTLGWDLSRVELHPGGGWAVDTDLGYRVELGSGWFVDHSVSFGPCVLPDAGAWRSPFHLGIRAAFAHDGADPSAVEAGHGEDLAKPTEVGPWQSVFPPARYCRAHWLVARATTPLDAPASAGLEGKSVVLSGSWSREGASGPLAVDTWWPHGHLEDLQAIVDPAELAAARASGKAWVAKVRVERALGALFDGIDFASASPEEITGTVVDNLAQHATLRASLFQPGSP